MSEGLKIGYLSNTSKMRCWFAVTDGGVAQFLIAFAFFMCSFFASVANYTIG